MIGYDDPVIAPCGFACESWFAYWDHRDSCDRCIELRVNEFGEPPRQPENDADDRGICYEDD